MIGVGKVACVSAFASVRGYTYDSGFDMAVRARGVQVDRRASR